jgi:hypothetical protein
MPRSTALGSGGDPLIWLGLAAAILFFVASGTVAYFNARVRNGREILCRLPLPSELALRCFRRTRRMVGAGGLRFAQIRAGHRQLVE